MDLLPPSVDQSYPSCEALISAVNLHAASERYAVVIKRMRSAPMHLCSCAAVLPNAMTKVGLGKATKPNKSRKHVFPGGEGVSG